VLGLVAAGALLLGPLFFAVAGGPPAPGPVVPVGVGATVAFDFDVCVTLPPPEDRLCDYGPLFHAAGNEARVDPRLLAAIAFVGSRFDPEVVNCRRPVPPDGPFGLMQVRAPVAAARGFDACDGSAAVTGVATYLRAYHDELGRWDEAIAAHASGVEAVRAAGGVPADGVTDRFVADVMATWQRYQQLFAGALADCPVRSARGPTQPYADARATRATQEMSMAVTACFGKPHPIYCYDRRTRGDGREGPYEHPRGRACDFMATSGGRAGRDDELWGRAMAEWLAANADELDVLYVIWFNKSWSSRDGYLPWDRWRTYQPGCDDGGCSPSKAHTNHVHVSIGLQPGDPPSASCPFEDCTE
jgi:hypothetical protein